MMFNKSNENYVSLTLLIKMLSTYANNILLSNEKLEHSYNFY